MMFVNYNSAIFHGSISMPMEVQNKPFNEHSVISPFFAMMMVMFNVFSTDFLIENVKLFYKKKSYLFMVFIFCFGSACSLFVQYQVLMFVKWIKAQINSAGSEPFVLYIPPVKTSNPQKTFDEFLQQTMIFREETRRNIKFLFLKILNSNVHGLNLKFLLTGLPGVGKSHLLKTIGSLCPKGALLIKISAFLQYENIEDIDPEEEIKKIDEILAYCKKHRLILIIDDSELFLSKRQSAKNPLNNRQAAKKDEKYDILNNFIGILSNYWLSVISATEITIVFASNMFHGLNLLIDHANGRRLTEIVNIPLPNKEERKEIFEIYLENIVLPQKPDYLESMAFITEGFSGRDIKKICIAIKVKLKINKTNFMTEQDLINEIYAISLYKNQNEVMGLDEYVQYFFEKRKNNNFNEDFFN